MSRALLLAFIFAMAIGHTAFGAERNTTDNASQQQSANAHPRQSSAMKIRLKVNGKAITATLVDSETTQDFASLLPLTPTMNDLFAREKSGDLPRPISEKGKRIRTYEVGDVIYWSPSAHLAIS